MTIELNGSQFILLHQKALYKPDEQLLIIADVHLGKASHFRKAGIAIPAHAQMGDYEKLASLFDEVNPQKVYFLGDLFHSSFNRDWHYFCELIAKYTAIKFILIKGNHDLINKKLFKDICIEVVDTIEDEQFVYSHEPVEVEEGKLNITGHVHPGITLSGAGRQSVKIPVFYIKDNLMIVPAFGMLTGLYGMERTKQTKIYAILPGGDERIVAI